MRVAGFSVVVQFENSGAEEDDRTALPLDLGDEGFAAFVEAPGVCEAELVYGEAERGLNFGHVEGERGPVCHG